MSDKRSKGYDPTQARMVGNILAGVEGLLDFDPHQTEIAIVDAIHVSDVVIKRLRKKWKEEGNED